MTIQDVERLALELPMDQRAELAAHLLESLESLSAEDNERLWLVEAEKRFEEYKKGNISSRLAEDVMREARERFR